MKKLILISFCSFAFCPPIPDWENGLYRILKWFFHERKQPKITLQPVTVPQTPKIGVSTAQTILTQKNLKMD